MEKKRNVDDQWMLNNSRNQSIGRSEFKPSLVHDHKEVLDRTLYVITADFEGISDQIVKSWEQWIVQLLQGHEDLEMTG